MKISNLRFNKKFFSRIIPYVLIFSIGSGGYCYYRLNDKQEQICADDIDCCDISIDEYGHIYKSFEVGEHHIKISRNDLFCHEFDKVEGYVIDGVSFDGLLDKCVISYVNSVPVVVQANFRKDNELKFDNFGIPANMEKNKKILK